MRVRTGFAILETGCADPSRFTLAVQGHPPRSFENTWA
jgi:hypothetical protein